MNKGKIPELVAPAGTFENLRTAIEFGADAVYLGPRAFSLRAGAENFEITEIEQAAEYVHTREKRLYLTLNSVMMERDYQLIKPFIAALKPEIIDGVIISDPSLVELLVDRGLAVHISTQVSVMNGGSASFWKKAGIKRIVLARELSLSDITSIVKSVDMEFEVFVHGAMCVSISGRCLMSDYLASRSGNRGECAQPCRWPFGLSHKTDGEVVFEGIEENEKTLIFNSRDLNTISIIGDILDTGVGSLKIEGRNKGIHYIASVVKVYREAIDCWAEHNGKFTVKKEWIDTLAGLSNRGYTTGFYKELALGVGRQYYAEKFAGARFIGAVRERLKDGWIVVDIRNDFTSDESVALISPEKGEYVTNCSILEMKSITGELLSRVAANRVVLMRLSAKASQGTLIRVY